MKIWVVQDERWAEEGKIVGAGFFDRITTLQNRDDAYRKQINR